MRRSRLSMVLTAVALAALAVLWARWSRPSGGLTTTSREAARLFETGDADARAFRWQAAEQALTGAVRADPGFAMARAALADLQRRLGRAAAADAEAARADSLARLLPPGPERWTVQLRLTLADPRFAAGRDSLLALLAQAQPHSPFVARMRALAATGQPDRAAEEAAWREVLRLDPNDADAWNQLGYLAARGGRYEEARADLRRYAFLAPDLANPHDSLGEILTWTGDYEQAEQELLQALRLQPDFFPSLLNLAVVYLEEGQLQRGIDLLEKVRAQIAGTDWEMRVDGLLLQTYYDQGLVGPLRHQLDRWIRHYPDQPETGFYRALAAALDHRFAAAQAACDSFLARAGQDPAAQQKGLLRERIAMLRHNFAAITARLQGDGATAATEYAAALAATTAWPPHEVWPLHLRYGETLLRLGRAEEALAQARLVLAVNPRRIGALLLETRADDALGRRDAARAALARLRTALARADRDLPAVAATDSLGARLDPRPPA
ncbi:MAG: tetratricopeptide repeat protein [Candidatus Krumholzibacteriia bacterium]